MTDEKAKTSNERPVPSNLPQLLRDAERRVNEHVWGDRRALVSIPADVSRDVDILLLTAADEIDRLQEESRQWDKASLVELVTERDRLRAALRKIGDASLSFKPFVDELLSRDSSAPETPRYYCRNCSCASCGNTRPTDETPTPYFTDLAPAAKEPTSPPSTGPRRFALPIINPGIFNEYVGRIQLIEIDADGQLRWTQTAIHFAYLLQSGLQNRLTMDPTSAPSAADKLETEASICAEASVSATVGADPRCEHGIPRRFCTAAHSDSLREMGISGS